MQAALMYGPNDIRVEEIDRPECPEGGFVLKVMAVGLCGSDIRNLTTDSKSGKYPHIYGHEITGIVDEVSPSCTEYKIGDRLYIYPADHCMQCEPCRTGHSEMCENLGNNLDRPGGLRNITPSSQDRSPVTLSTEFLTASAMTALLLESLYLLSMHVRKISMSASETRSLSSAPDQSDASTQNLQNCAVLKKLL